MTTQELCAWLREHSSGVYRPAADAADLIERLLSAPASTGREPFAWESTTPIYTRFITDARYQKLRPAYQKWYRPICNKCAPVAARELDVEAERDQFSQWHLEKFGYKPSDEEAYGHPFDIWLAARNASPTTVDTVNTSSERVQNAQGNRHVGGGAGLGFESAETRMDSGFDGGAGLAPVSTEQAGDAWISVEDRLPEKECLAAYSTPNGKVRLIRAKYARKFQIEAEDDDCETEYNEDDDTFYIKEGWLECIDNWGEYSSCYVVEGIVTHWMPLPAAPSPNNSRVGADKESK